MKKEKLFCLAGLLILLALGAGAQQGGFTGPAAAPATVAEALNMRDDTPVTLQGKIVRSLGGEKYLFQDSTGTITIDIDDKIWRNISVDQNDVVEISGEIDRDRRGLEVDVETLRKLDHI
jgi:uncharacterized protein (TIGR00156 family)